MRVLVLTVLPEELLHIFVIRERDARRDGVVGHIDVGRAQGLHAIELGEALLLDCVAITAF